MASLDTAYEKLTNEQKRRIDAMLKEGGHSNSRIACKLSLTKSFVDSYVRFVNSSS